MTDNIATQTVHAGEDKQKPFGALATPIIQTSTYTFANTAEILAFMEQKTARTAARKAGDDLEIRGEYGRYGNPTHAVAEKRIAALEGGERAVLFSSGMNAITTTMLALLSAGDHAIVVRDCYRRTREFANTFLPRWGIESTLVRVDDLDALAAAVRPNTRLIFTETPTNPYLRITDLAAVAEIAQPRGIITAVDSTFATPVNIHPLDLGIDLVIHSATKYLAGHNDLLAGVVVGANRLRDEDRGDARPSGRRQWPLRRVPSPARPQNAGVARQAAEREWDARGAVPRQPSRRRPRLLSRFAQPSRSRDCDTPDDGLWWRRELRVGGR